LVFSAWLGIGSLPDPAGGVIYLAVPWAGAAGGLAISLVGVCNRASDWDPRWNVWHAFRPVLGVVFGTAGVLIFVLFPGTLTVTTESDIATLDDVSVALLGVVAFVIGYRESTVRELIKRVTDTILTPDSGKAEEVGGATPTTPDTLAFSPVVVGGQETRVVRVHNRSSAEVSLVRLDLRPPVFTVFGDPATTPIPADSVRDIGVTFRPDAAGDVTGQLVLLVGSDSTVIPLSGKGT
jgi:hypothetical protein